MEREAPQTENAPGYATGNGKGVITLKMWKHAGRRVARQTVLVTALTLLMTAAALAAEEHAAPRWGDFGWRVLNFVLFAGILWYFVGGLARKYFSGRRRQIQEGLDDLEQRRSDAKKRLAEVEQRIAHLEAERKAILDESAAQAERLKAGILEAERLKAGILDEARRQADQILEQARRTAENEGRTILAEVRAAVADEIVDAAQKALVEKLDAQGHEALIAKSLNKVVLQ